MKVRINIGILTGRIITLSDKEARNLVLRKEFRVEVDGKEYMFRSHELDIIEDGGISSLNED